MKKRLRIGSDRLLRNSMLAGTVMGVLTALVMGAGSALGAEDMAQGSWVVDNAVGAYRYFGADGQMWTNAITPDGYYVDRNGVMIHPQYEIERFTTIPSDAKSLLVIEGHGNAGRATFYLKEETVVEPENKAASNPNDRLTAGPGNSVLMRGQTMQTVKGADTESKTAVSRQSPGETAQESQTVANSTAALTGEQKKIVSWKEVFNTNATLGRLGIGKEVEGDEKTPRGYYTLDTAFGTEPDPGNFNVPYLQVHDGHYWVGDSESSYYNQLVDIRQTGNVFDKRKSEHLSTIAGIGYHYCMSVGYNKTCTPYKGSAIFLHCIEGPVTAGCIGIPKEDMMALLENIQQPAYILIDDGENLINY
ncbi:MAG: L,D-transpeptidase family protein [Lachnospiraceae bacterium]|nr:L,D-transpeptidase family protein [Lachnospiraceae bacterium]